MKADTDSCSAHGDFSSSKPSQTKDTAPLSAMPGSASAATVVVDAMQSAPHDKSVTHDDCQPKNSNDVDREERSLQPLALEEIREDGTDGFPDLSMGRTTAIISVLTAVMFTSSMSTGLVTIGIPIIAADIHLPSHLILWSVLTEF